MGKILLAEDEKNIVLTIKLCLKRAGFEVIVAEDGVKALDLALEKDWDLMLLDLRLPRMDGFLVLEALNSEKKMDNFPVIVITALSGEEDRIRAKQLGVTDYIVKPVEAEKLLSRVKAQIREVDKE